MNTDEQKIFELYESVVSEGDQPQPQMETSARGTMFWRIKGRLHREDGPAVIRKHGDKEWWQHGELHRIGGPAIEDSDGDKEWWVNGQRHREDGPAVEYKDHKGWYLNDDVFLTPEGWAAALLRRRKQPYDEQAVQNFLRSILKKDVEEAL